MALGREAQVEALCQAEGSEDERDSALNCCGDQESCTAAVVTSRRDNICSVNGETQQQWNANMPAGFFDLCIRAWGRMAAELRTMRSMLWEHILG